MARRQVKTTETKTNLPDHVVAGDLAYPSGKEKMAYEAGDHGMLVFLRSERFGWCVGTLWINRNQNRTYASTLSGETVTIGNSQTEPVYVYVKESRVKALQPWLDARTKGLERAGEVRDRIGSRRVEGQIKRSQGLRSWRWDN